MRSPKPANSWTNRAAPSPTTLRCTTAEALLNVRDGGTTPSRPRVPYTLSDPSLTGMTRQELDRLIERLAPRQAAQAERHRYQRRGGDRLPGARGGVFQQKITDAERVLATVLYQRRVCTRQVLADLFEVSPRTIGNALIEVRSLLDQDGYDPAPATSRFRSATALLASLAPPIDMPDVEEPLC